VDFHLKKKHKRTHTYAHPRPLSYNMYKYQFKINKRPVYNTKNYDTPGREHRGGAPGHLTLPMSF
jgi:hypothetical protein